MILGGGQRDALGSGKAMPLVLGNYWSCEVNSTVTKNKDRQQQSVRLNERTTSSLSLCNVLFCDLCRCGAESILLLGDDHELRVDDQSPIPLVRIEPGLFSMGCSSRGSLIAAILSLGEQGDWVTEGPVRKRNHHQGVSDRQVQSHDGAILSIS